MEINLWEGAASADNRHGSSFPDDAYIFCDVVPVEDARARNKIVCT